MSLTDEQLPVRRSNKKTIIIIVLIAVAVFVIGIAAISFSIGMGVPAWKAMVRGENGTSAVQSLQTIRALQAQYASKNQGKFAPNFDELIKVVGLDERFVGDAPIVNGYIFLMKVEAATSQKPAFYSINVEPQIYDTKQSSGARHFYIDSKTGVVKFTEENRPAKADDPSI